MIPKIAHSFVDGFCSVCGSGQTSEGLAYRLLDGVYYAVAGLGTCTDTEIIIPDTHEDLPVTRIDSCAFLNNKQITKVVIPESITEIGNSAFDECSNLTEIVLPDSLQTLGSHAFDGCSNLTEIVLPDSLQKLGSYALGRINASSTSLTFNEYENCKYYGSESNPYMILVGVIDANATSFTIHEETKFIYSDAMHNCTSVTDIALPEGLLGIGFWSMAGMKSVKTFNIPSSVIDIDEYAFANAASLETITVAEGNKVFASINNSLVNVKTKTLVAGCKNSVIPNDGSVKILDDGAFNGCVGLTEIEIPEGIEQLQYFVFRDCTNLTSLHIPSTVVKIGRNPVSGCTALTELTVDENNSVYRSEGNCVIERETNRVIMGCTNSVIPEGVQVVGDISFDESMLTEVVIPNTVTAIEQYAFHFNKELKTIEIPTSVTTIGERAFEGCDALATVYYGGTAEQWAAISIGSSNDPLLNANVVFNYVPDTTVESLVYTELADGTLAVSGIGTVTSSEIVIPSEHAGKKVTQIANDALGFNNFVCNVVIPDGVTGIGDRAFYMSEKLDTVTIPDSVTYIGERAFAGCFLQTVTYGGTAEQWNAVIKDEHWHENMTSYVIYCTDGNLSK